MLCFVTEMTRPIKGEHSREDDVTPVMSPGNATSLTSIE